MKSKFTLDLQHEEFKDFYEGTKLYVVPANFMYSMNCLDGFVNGSLGASEEVEAWKKNMPKNINFPVQTLGKATSSPETWLLFNIIAHLGQISRLDESKVS